MLLRRGHVWNARTKSGTLKKAWTADYGKWPHSISFDDSRAQATFDFHVKTAEEDIERAKKLARRCREAAGLPGVKPYVDALSRLKGVDALVALAFVASVGDFARFGNGRLVSSYFGLTPTKHDSGPKRGNNGRITKAGDTSVRKVEGRGISARPAEAADRAVPGHWEGDLVVGGDMSSCLITLIERRSRFLLMSRLCVHDADTVEQRLERMAASIPDELKKTLT